MKSLKTRLTDALTSKGLIPHEELTRALHDAGAGEKNFVRLLIDRGLMTEQQLSGLLAEDLGIPVISLAKYRVDHDAAKLIPERVARQYTLIPISRFGERLVVAMSDPLNIFALDDLKTLTPYAVDPVLAPEAEIRRAIEQVYDVTGSTLPSGEGNGGSMVGASPAEEALEHTVQLLLSKPTGDEAPTVTLINLIIVEALKQDASDIHLEPQETGLRVRYRVDGHLVDAHQLPKAIQNTVLTRLKILSGMDITEWRLPQDGRFKARLDAQEVDFRVSVLPITHGGKAVLRVLEQQSVMLGLEYLGFLPEDITAFQDVIKRPYGMVLVTGPTGAGKSTTLYSLLAQLNTPARNVITIEDPVEYQVEGVTQVQVHPDIGLTFASGLRSILRQNPDVVMIGEIRDSETADIAMKASLTGHLVLSTLHTNDAASSVTRLVDMGVEPFLVASSVTLIEAQRLVRKLCVKCRQPYQPPASLLARLKAPADAAGTFYHAKGCPLCRRTGYRGRTGIIEALVVDDHIREQIVTNAQSREIKQYAMEQRHMRTLREDGLRKAAMGLTTLEEVLHASADE